MSELFSAKSFECFLFFCKKWDLEGGALARLFFLTTRDTKGFHKVHYT